MLRRLLIAILRKNRWLMALAVVFGGLILAGLGFLLSKCWTGVKIVWGAISWLVWLVGWPLAGLVGLIERVTAWRSEASESPVWATRPTIAGILTLVLLTTYVGVSWSLPELDREQDEISFAEWFSEHYRNCWRCTICRKARARLEAVTQQPLNPRVVGLKPDDSRIVITGYICEVIKSDGEVSDLGLANIPIQVFRDGGPVLAEPVYSSDTGRFEVELRRGDTFCLVFFEKDD